MTKLTIETIPSIPERMNVSVSEGSYDFLHPSNRQMRVRIRLDVLIFSLTLDMDKWEDLYISEDSAWWEIVSLACGAYGKTWAVPADGWVIPADGPEVAKALAAWAEEAWQEETDEHQARLEAIETLELNWTLDAVERYARGKLGLRVADLAARLTADRKVSA